MCGSNLALVFPGQGCQFVGMGKDLWETFPQARALYARADDVLGYPLSTLCFDGPEEALNDTANTQPAIYVTTLALWQVLAPRLETVKSRIAFVAGHSLGEFSALAVAGALTFEDGLRLVRCRGEAMRDAGISAPGGMAAIIGLDDEAVAAIVAEANALRTRSTGDQSVWAANYNAPGQVVIAGEREALQQALELAKARCAKRAAPLAVSVACHTPLMRPAAERLGAALEATPLQRPWAAVVSNALATPLTEPAAIKAALLKQLTAPVRWVESVQVMASQGAATMLEIGPRAVVSALIKRINGAIAVQAVTDAASAATFEGEGLV